MLGRKAAHSVIIKGGFAKAKQSIIGCGYEMVTGDGGSAVFRKPGTVLTFVNSKVPKKLWLKKKNGGVELLLKYDASILSDRGHLEEEMAAIVETLKGK